MNSPLIHSQLAQLSTRFEFARNIVNRSRTLGELAQAMANRPTVPAHLRMLSEVRRAGQQLTQAGETQGKKLVERAMMDLIAKVGTPEYTQLRARFLADVRHLYPRLPLIARSAVRGLRAFEHAQAKDNQPEADSVRPPVPRG